MRIYLTNLSQYNGGRLIGQWIELPCAKEELQDAMSQVLCLDEEYFITDSEEIPFAVGEFDNPFELNDQLEQYEALDCHERLCVAFLLSEGYDWTYCIDHHENVTVYPQERLEDVAYSLVEDGCFGTVPESLKNYIDHAAIARDLGYDGYVQRTEGVFYYAE